MFEIEPHAALESVRHRVELVWRSLDLWRQALIQFLDSGTASLGFKLARP